MPVTPSIVAPAADSGSDRSMHLGSGLIAGRVRGFKGEQKTNNIINGNGEKQSISGVILEKVRCRLNNRNREKVLWLMYNVHFLLARMYTMFADNFSEYADYWISLSRRETRQAELMEK